MSHLRRFSGLCLLVLSGCVSSPALRPVVSTPSAAAPSVARNVAGPWRVGVQPSSQRITLATDAVVSFTGDPGPRTDTLHARFAASYVLPAGGKTSINGLLTEYRVALGDAPLTVPSGLQLGRPFSAERLSGSRVLLFRLPVESSLCTDPALSVLQTLHDVWISLPDTIQPGRAWSDTVHTVSCRDRIPLRGSIVRTFRVLRGQVDENGRVIVTIERLATGRLSGDGEQFGERVGVEGASTGTLLYVLDPIAGQLLRATGSSVLTLSLKSPRRTQTARQESRVTYTWLP